MASFPGSRPTIFYYTGTGNALWTARLIGEGIGGADIISMALCPDEKKVVEGCVTGFVFPVYIWGVPAPVIRFIESLDVKRTGYSFAAAVNGGQVSNTLVQLKGIMAGSGIALSAGFQIRMPSNYIPWGGPGPREEQLRRFAQAREKISRIAGHIRKQDVLPVEKGPLWQRILFTAIYRMSFPKVPAMDRPFRTDEKCNRCGICEKVCPAGNITLSGGKPVWNHRCDQCFACLQWCPQEAIQYGRKTPAYERYRHPEITLKDVLKRG
ncbi:MAG TPA: EFR1 family ferrodoxin [Deltaproteobacteria bacterium]|nr:EFR1 family ferrodoxin [Deltaproteobacteria bacterium]